MSQQINLLRPKTRARNTAVGTAVATGLVLVALLSYWQIMVAESDRLQEAANAGAQNLDQVRIAIAMLQRQKASQGSAAELNAEIAMLRPRAAAMDQLLKALGSASLGSQAGLAQHFSTLSSVAVEDLWLTNVAVSQGGSAVAISGRALRNDAVMLYARRLNDAFSGRGITFKSLELLPENAGKPAAPGVPAPSVVAFKLS